MKKEGLCIYHKDCNDGFAAALAVWKRYGDKWDYQPMQYGDDLPEIADLNHNIFPWMYKNIMLVDFSLPRDYMVKLSKLTNLLVIDHHKTAQKDCEGLDFCKFDLDKAGCTATWDYLFPDKPSPCMFNWIADRDLWKFDLTETKEFCAGLAMIPREFEKWKNVCEYPDGVIVTGKAILQLQEKQTKDFVTKWHANKRFAKIGGYEVPIANCTDLVSERIGALSEGYMFACGYFETDKRRVFSLRTRNDEVDCGVIAKLYGGGGHPGAAGFSIDLNKVDNKMDDLFFKDYKKFTNE